LAQAEVTPLLFSLIASSWREMGRIMCAVVVFMLTCAAVQAAASEVPHVTNKYGKKKTPQLGNPLMMKDPSAMLTELEEMVHSGEAPAFDMISMIKSTIQDDIMPALQTTRDAAVNATIDHLDAIQVCNDESLARADTIAGSEQESVNTARSVHAACRDAEQTMHYHNLSNPESYCVKLGKFLHDAKPLSIRDGSTRAEAVNYVKSVSNSANMCSGSGVTELDDNCTQTEEALRSKGTDCLQKQRSFETAFCKWKTALEKNCEDLDDCYSTALAAYWHGVNKTGTLMEKWNVEAAALHKILCYCDVWLSDTHEGDNRSEHNATHFEVCKDQTHTPPAWLPDPPADKVACPLTSVACHPGQTCFDQEYSSFSEFVEQAVPCCR